MSKKQYSNSAMNAQLLITAEINELLKNRGINVPQLKVDLTTVVTKNKETLSDKEIIKLEGSIFMKINPRLNKKNTFNTEEDEESLLDEDYDADQP